MEKITRSGGRGLCYESVLHSKPAWKSVVFLTDLQAWSLCLQYRSSRGSWVVSNTVTFPCGGHGSMEQIHVHMCQQGKLNTET